MLGHRAIWYKASSLEARLSGYPSNLNGFLVVEQALQAELFELLNAIAELDATHLSAKNGYIQWLDQLQAAFSLLQRASIPIVHLMPSPTTVKQVAPFSSQSNTFLSQKLPPREFPTFSGEFKDWPEFKDELLTLASNHRYTIEDRFQRLSKSMNTLWCKNLVRGFRENHDLMGAIQALQEHFENPKRVLDSAREMAKNAASLSNYQDPSPKQ